MKPSDDVLKNKPVIFLAFANDRVNKASYLRNLAHEQRNIRKALAGAENGGLCEIIERSHATIDDILDVFQDKKNHDRIAIFHYGGHADCYKLLLESFKGSHSFAFKEGLVSFFSRQKGLKLIFLNACSTEQHALELIQAGIPSVIGTSQAIADETAANLAIRFYTGIGNGFPIDRAWREAEDEIKITRGISDFSALYHWEQKEKSTDRFPWNIHFKEGAEIIREWNLPDAARDPLFGLPGIPGTYDLPEAPFLFLRHYEEKYARIFFGRGDYIRNIYNRLIDPKLPHVILFYGQSGVGKSSLLQAGLIPRLKGSHKILYEKRNRHKGLLGTLADILPLKSFCRSQGGGFLEKSPLVAEGIDSKVMRQPEPRGAEGLLEFVSKTSSYIDGLTSNSLDSGSFQLLRAKSQELRANLKSSLIIILDQVEEIYTHPNPALPDELKDFLEALNFIFKEPGGPGFKLVLGYRKEYHAEIEKHFSYFQVPRSYIFLEPLCREGIIDVVTGLTLSPVLKQRYCNLEVEPGLPGIIADDLLSDKHSPIAPVLQILLTKMWHMAIKESYHAAVFSIKNYRQLRKQGIAMEDFFHQQMEELKKWKPGVVNSGLALDVLKFHTTPLASACTREIEPIKQTYSNNLEIIDDLLKQLKNLYLLTDTLQHENETSLAHDTLAPVIIKEYNHSDKPGQRSARILAAKIEDFIKDKKHAYLDDLDLVTVDQGKSGMRSLTLEEEELLEKSRKRKILKLKQKKRLISIGILLIIAVIVFAGFAYWQWRNAEANFIASTAQLNVGKDPTYALSLAEKAWKIKKNETTCAAIYSIFRENNFYKIIARTVTSVSSSVLSPNGRYLFTVYNTGFGELWSVSGESLKKFGKAMISSAVFSPGGEYLLFRGLNNNNLLLWKWRSDDLTAREWKKENGYIAAISPDGNDVLTILENMKPRLMKWGGQVIRDFAGDNDSITCASFFPDGRGIITGSQEGKIRMWNIAEKKQTLFKGQHTKRISSISISPDGNYILTGSLDETARLWDIKGNERQVFIGHTREVLLAGFSSIGKNIVTVSRDKTIRHWRLKGIEEKIFRAHSAPVRFVMFSSDGSQILTHSTDGTARIWDKKKGKTLKILEKLGNPITSAAFSPNGQYVFTGFKDGKMQLWYLTGQGDKVFMKKHSRVVSCAFSPDGKNILTGFGDSTAWLSDLAGNDLQVFEGHKNSVTLVAFSHDGKHVLTGSYDTSPRLWSLNGKVEQVLKGDIDWVTCASFSPDGFHLVTGSIDKTIILWDLKGNILGRFKGHDKTIQSVCFSPHGRYILSGSTDRTARLWDLKGNQLQVFRCYEGYVRSVAFSPDGEYILTGSSDGTARLWKISTVEDFLKEDFDYQ